MNDILIIGAGKVGTATNMSIGNVADYHDPFKGLVNNNFSKYNYIIICVDTTANGPKDYIDLESVLDELNDADYGGIVVIRSTVSPIKTREWDSKYSLRYIIFPEFMPQKEGQLIADTAWIAVLGGKEADTKMFANNVLVANNYPADIKSYVFCSKKEAAIIKLADNAALSTKLIYFNAIYKICESLDVSYETVRQAIGMDNRIGIAHSIVPSPDDGLFGFGGHCLPKDIKVLSEIDDLGFFKTVDGINNTLRKF